MSSDHSNSTAEAFFINQASFVESASKSDHQTSAESKASTQIATATDNHHIVLQPRQHPWTEPITGLLKKISTTPIQPVTADTSVLSAPSSSFYGFSYNEEDELPLHLWNDNTNTVDNEDMEFESVPLDFVYPPHFFANLEETDDEISSLGVEEEARVVVAAEQQSTNGHNESSSSSSLSLSLAASGLSSPSAVRRALNYFERRFQSRISRNRASQTLADTSSNVADQSTYSMR
jgi:hypothetical protein